MKLMSRAALVALLLSAGPVLAADPPAQAPAAAPAIQAAAADVSSIDAILAALYSTVSGSAGQARDWNRLHSLMAPHAHFMAIGQRPDGTIATRVMTVDDYITRNSPFFAKEGFYESEAKRSTEQFGQVASVFSTYEARHAPGEKPFMRGVNSIQLYNDGTRWWIASLIWRAEDAKLPLPERYAPKS